MTDFKYHHPNVPFIELTTTANLILRGKGLGGKDSFSVWYGGDYSEHSQEMLLTEPTTIGDLSDLSLFWLEDQTERELLNQFNLIFDSSNVTVQEIICYVFILRSYRSTRDRKKRRGRQIVLF